MVKEINKKQILAYPTSYIQKRIWFLEKMEKGRIKNNIGIVSIFSGVTRFEDLRNIFQKIINRHEILRTNFYETESEELVQVVNENQEVDFSYFDLRSFDVKKKEEEKKAIIKNLKNRSFNLAEDVLMRFALISLADDKQVVVIVGHHIVIDSWSMSVIAGEFFQLAQALFYKETVDLPDLFIQYKDYAAWEQSDEFINKLKVSENYWLKSLEGELPILDLPADNSRLLLQKYDIKIETIEIEPQQKKIVDVLCRKYDVTLFVFFYAILSIILQKLSGQKEFVLGTYAANRDLPELDGVVGPLLNSLVMRSRVDDNKNFSEFLLETKEQVLLNLKHKDYPFEKLVEKLTLNRDISRTPIFNTVFQVFNSGGNNGIKKNIFFERTEDYQTFDKTLGQFDLSFHLHNREDDLLLALSYNKDLFSQASAKRYLKYFRKILSELAQAEDKLIKNINIVPEDELEFLLETFNHNEVILDDKENIFSLFEKQMKKTPDKVALIFAEQRFSYRELFLQVNLFARYFFDCGVKKGKVVGLAISRTSEYVFSVLALMRLGAICVPINKTDPSSRLEFMVRDASMDFIVSDSLENNFSELASVINICNIRVTEKNFELVENKTNLEEVAFIIYTSGSTGKPRGVKLLQRGIINHAFGKINFLSLNSKDRVAQNLATSFVASLWQFFSPLFVGASVVIYPEEKTMNFSALFDSICIDQVTIWETNATILSYLLSQEIRNFSPELRVLLTGEDTPDVLVDKFYSIYNIPLINSYGQTECSDDTLMYEIPRSDSRVLLGKPLLNTQVYILDENKKIVPTMTSGEIYISGDCLSAGYLNDLDENRKKFLAHPFVSGKLIYRTGDIGRRCVNGEIEYLGRIDRQVKIRGVRIEVSEVENLILKREDVTNCLVIKREEKMVAYYTGKKIKANELRIYLASFLPIVMLPTYYVHLDKFYLNANSKIDKAKLPEPQERNKAHTVSGAPRTEREKFLAKLWQKILQVKAINQADDFFALGGNSLKALSLIGELRKVGYQVSLRDVFHFPCLSDLSNFLKTKQIEQKIQGGLPMTVFGDWLKHKNFNLSLLADSICLEAPGLVREIIVNSAKKVQDYFADLEISLTEKNIATPEELRLVMREKKKQEGVDLQILFFKNQIFLRATIGAEIRPEKFMDVLFAWQKNYNLELAGSRSAVVYTPFSSYPDYYHCIHANFLEKVYFETKNFFYQSLLPAYDYFLLPSYVVVSRDSRCDSDFNAYYLGKSEIFISARKFGLEARVIKLATKTEAEDYLKKNASAKPILLMGNNYYLPASTYYKNEEFITSLREDRNLLPMNFSIFQFDQDNILASSANLNYFGQINKDDFWGYWKNFRDFELAKAPTKEDMSFQVFPLANLDNLVPHNIDMLYEALRMNVEEFFGNKIFFGNSKNNFEKIFFGQQVFEEFRKDIEKNLVGNSEAISDIVILDMFKRIQKPQLFLNDILEDIVIFNDDFSFDLNKLAALICLGDGIFEKLYKKAKKHKIKYEANLSFLPGSEAKKIKFLSKEEKEELVIFADNLYLGLGEIYKSLSQKLED